MLQFNIRQLLVFVTVTAVLIAVMFGLNLPVVIRIDIAILIVAVCYLLLHILKSCFEQVLIQDQSKIQDRFNTTWRGSGISLAITYFVICHLVTYLPGLSGVDGYYIGYTMAIFGLIAIIISIPSYLFLRYG